MVNELTIKKKILFNFYKIMSLYIAHLILMITNVVVFIIEDYQLIEGSGWILHFNVIDRDHCNAFKVIVK